MVPEREAEARPLVTPAVERSLIFSQRRSVFARAWSAALAVWGGFVGLLPHVLEPNKKIVVKRAGRARARRADEARPRTNDRVADAQQAAETYRITTPLVADEDRDMTGAYDVLGQGMHPNAAGHTFILVDRQG